MEKVVPCRFRVLLTFLVNWRTGSVCKRVLPSFIVLGNRFFFAVPGSSLRIVGVFWIFFFSMRRVSPLLFHHPTKVCILESHLRRRRCVEWAWFKTHLAVGFPRSYRHPQTLGAIGLDAAEEVVAIKEEKIIAAGRELDTTLSSSFWFCILFAIVLGQLIKLKFLVQPWYSKWSWNGWYSTKWNSH